VSKVLNIQKLLETGAWSLKDVSSTASLDSILILLHIIKKDKTFVLTYPDFVVTKLEYEKFNKLIDQRKKGVPVEYLINNKEFWGIDFFVNNSVLIPRPETELIVEYLINKIKSSKKEVFRVLDLGTGSGCISIALKSELKERVNIDAVDLSTDALKVAKLNAQNEKVKINFFESNWFEGVKEKYDFIISNPPYVILDDPNNSINLKYEPSLALYSRDSGLADIKNIITNNSFMKENGELLIEFGYNQKEILEKYLALKKLNHFFIKDLAGIFRVVVIKY